MKKISIFFIFLIFSFSSLADNYHKKEIDKLFDQLKSPLDFENSKKIEDKIWDLWTTHPSEIKLTKLLSEGSLLMNENKFEEAYDIFTKVINKDPRWAEAWNKRATVLYLMGKYELSQADINKVLEIEKRHFGALSGQGLVQIALKNYEKAIDSYIKAHRIHPFMKSPMIMIEKLQIEFEKQYGVKFNWKPFSVRAIMKEMNNIPFPRDKINKVNYMWRDIERRSEQYGFFAKTPVPYPLSEFDLANQIAILGLENNWGIDYIRMTYKKWFQEGKEPAIEPSISEICKELKLEKDKVLLEAKSEKIEKRYLLNTESARKNKIFGSPSFVVNNEIFWGDDRMEDAINWSKK